MFIGWSSSLFYCDRKYIAEKRGPKNQMGCYHIWVQITEILLKLALNTNQSINYYSSVFDEVFFIYIPFRNMHNIIM